VDPSRIDVDAIIRETIDFVTVRPDGDAWAGETPTWFGEYLFGGFVVAQAIYAATRTAPKGRRIHSLHAYFLRPVAAGRPVTYRITELRDGRSVATRQLVAAQDESPVLTMTCSFAADRDGYEYELPFDPGILGPEDLATSQGPGPWVAAELGPTPAEADGTRRSTHRMWFRIPGRLPEDPHLHAALVGFATDWTGTGGRPLHLEGDTEGMISLDHAVWFHRAPRADQWLFYDVQSLVNTAGRGLLTGTMHQTDRHLAVSVAQEMLLKPVGS
jgi:acyl-CoA thioesterase II